MASSADEPIPIAFCITDLDAGGAERALVQIVTRLDRSRWRPEVFCLAGPGALADRLAEADVRTTCLGARSVWNVHVPIRLARLLRRSRPALLQTFLYHANVAGRLAAWMAGVPHVVAGIRVAERRSGLRHLVDRWTAPLVDCHVCVSEDVARFTRERAHVPAERLEVIANGVDFERFADAEPADLSEFGLRGKRVLLFVGRLDLQKGPDLLLDALPAVFERHPDVHLLLVGDGPLRGSLERRVSETPALGGRVRFAGRRDDVPALLKAAECLVLPSRWEGLPNVVLEAMAAGRPVVASRVEGVAELLGEGRFGRCTRPESAADLTLAVQEVLDAPDHFAELALSAQREVAQNLTWDSAAAAYDALYRRILGLWT